MQTGTEAGRKTGIDSRRHKQCSAEEEGVKNRVGGWGGVGGYALFLRLRLPVPPRQLRWGGDKQTRRRLKSRQAFFPPSTELPLSDDRDRKGGSTEWVGAVR